MVAVTVVIPSSGKGAARAAAGEKESTPERAHVKEEEVDKAALPPVATKGWVRARRWRELLRWRERAGDGYGCAGKDASSEDASY
jgi:hypothetical protein